MKEWAAGHPKAKIMARKRALILDAAHDAFLRDGYGGTSMEGIAASAGVSIMTLYRHAESKDDLFAAVIARACHPDDQSHQARIEEARLMPLGDVLVFVGMIIQKRIASPTTTTLFRAVMVETRRFPHLADMAYQGLIVSHKTALELFLADRAETKYIDADKRRELSAGFLDRLVGLDVLRALLGLNVASEEEQLERAHRAAADLLGAIKTK